jgi:cell division protein FtsQ
MTESEPVRRAAPPRVRRPRRPRPRRIWRAAFFALALTGIIGGVTWALLGSTLLVVRSVAVTGTNLVPVAEVLSAAEVQPGTPMVRVSTAQITARVERIRQVRSVEVVKSWPDRIVIEVHERDSAVAVAMPSGGYDLVDAYGVVVRWVAFRPDRFPLYVTATPAASLRGDPGVGLAAAVLGELPAQLRSTVVSLSVPDHQVKLILAGGDTVVWGDTGSAGTKAQVLAILMRTDARYYDVSAPGTAMTEG